MANRCKIMHEPNPNPILPRETIMVGQEKKGERKKEKKRDRKGNEVNDAMQIDRWVCVSIDP